MSALAPPPPNVAQITLPPGFTLEQFLSLQGQLIRLAIVVGGVLAILLWDYFVLLPDELAIYSSHDKRLWRQPATWCFIILRYSGLLSTIPALFFTMLQTQHCQVAAALSQVGAVLVVISSGAIFCFRIIAIWNGHKYVHSVVGFFYLLMVACWLAVATQFRAKTGPPTPYLSNCQPLPIKKWAPISYSSSVAFDSIVLILTLSKLHGNLMATKSQVGRQIYRDNLGYFFVTTVANVTVLTIQCLGERSNLVKATAVPFSTLMTTTMGARVFLNLKLFDQRQQRELTSSVNPSQVNSRSSHLRFSSTQLQDMTSTDTVVDVRRPFSLEAKSRPSLSGPEALAV